jgi:hypothetical protein
MYGAGAVSLFSAKYSKNGDPVVPETGHKVQHPAEPRISSKIK